MIIKSVQEKVKDKWKSMQKKYFSNLTENSKFTFYCQNQFFALHNLNGMMAHQGALLKHV